MRINFVGGPGAGKSTTAAWIFSELKTRTIPVEHVSEFVKTWTYTGRTPFEFDQVLIFGKQMDSEHVFLANGVKNIVTDSPTLLSAIYAEVYCKDLGIHTHIEKINDAYEKRHPSLYIFLDRQDKPYVKEGRYQSYEQAKEVDTLVLNTIDRKIKEGVITNFVKIPYNDREQILSTVIKNISL